MEKPHIIKNSNGDDWCKSYAGFFNPGIGTGKKTHCDAGVEYASVEKKVDYTYAYKHSPKSHHEGHIARPCFKSEYGLTAGCSKCQFLTQEEIVAKHAEIDASINRIGIARKAIIPDLEGRRERGEQGAIMNAESDPDVEDGPRNFVSGQGVIDCPICKTGKLGYSRSTYNGHVHARCSTTGCVSWME